MKVILDDISLCGDCMLVAETGEYDSLDYHYGRGESPGRGELRPGAKERAAEIDAGLAKFGPHLVSDFDTESGRGYTEFSWRRCNCCNTRLGGARYSYATLGDE